MPRPLSSIHLLPVHPLRMSHYKILKKRTRMQNPWFQTEPASSPKETFSVARPRPIPIPPLPGHPLRMSEYKIFKKCTRMQNPVFQTGLASSPKENFSATRFLPSFFEKKRRCLSGTRTKRLWNGSIFHGGSLLFLLHSPRPYFYYQQSLFC